MMRFLVYGLIMGCVFDFAAAVRTEYQEENEDAAAVITKDDFQEGSPPLCDEGIVASTCYLLSGDHETRDIGPDQLQTILAANDESIADAWSVLKLQSLQVRCDELCSKVVDYLKEVGNCPPKSNLGCYRGADGGNVCDLDLNTKAVTKAADFKGDLPDLHDKKIVESTGNHVPPEIQALDDKPLDYYDTFVLVQRIANLFHIYPSNHRIDEEVSLIQSNESSRSRPDWLGGVLDLAADAAFGALDAAIPTNRAKDLKLSEDPSKTTGAWLVEVQKINLKAQAYITRAIKRFQARDTEVHIKKWFGNKAYTDESARARVQKILNSVNNMLANIAYVYPGGGCDERTYAYVYPKGEGSVNKKGQKLFYLCKVYMDSKESEQIETLVHEGSHHATAFTDDVDFNGKTAYGRSTCEALAKQEPQKSLDNADNFCYYVQDITDAEYSGEPNPSKPSPAKPTPPKPNQPCVDKGNHCEDWAKSGECEKNPKFMHTSCAKSCGKCKAPACVDKNNNCAGWAKTGECQKNPRYMNGNCAKSCGTGDC